MDSNNSERDSHIINIVKSNLISCGLIPVAIDLITRTLAQDLIDFLDNYYNPFTPDEEE